MYRLILGFGILLCLLSTAHAQEEADFKWVNAETYRLYQEQEWDSLIAMGREAIRQDLDYYYLRMRLGIAYYSKGNYRKAATHFSRALDFNQGDPVSLEYLYYCMLLSGQAERAEVLRNQFRGELARELPASGAKFAERISAGYLYSRGIDTEEFPEEFTNYPGIQNAALHFSNASLSLVNRLSPRLSLLHELNVLSKTNAYLSFDGMYGHFTLDQKVLQTQYYISPHITIGHGSVLMPVFHLLGIRYQDFVMQGAGYQGGSAVYSLEEFKKKAFVTGLGFKQGLGTMDLHMGIYYSQLNQLKQVQNRLGLTCFPLGNLKLYAGAYLNTQYEYAQDYEGVFRFIPEAHFGFALAEKVWFDLNAALGEMSNYLENNGSIVYNSFSEYIDKKVEFTLSLPVSNKGSLLYLGGRWTASRSEYHTFDPDAPNELNTLTYNTLSIYGGISWKL
jgi:tetratricopeptide (TPR) repeat protein